MVDEVVDVGDLPVGVKAWKIWEEHVFIMSESWSVVSLMYLMRFALWASSSSLVCSGGLRAFKIASVTCLPRRGMGVSFLAFPVVVSVTLLDMERLFCWLEREKGRELTRGFRRKRLETCWRKIKWLNKNYPYIYGKVILFGQSWEPLGNWLEGQCS